MFDPSIYIVHNGLSRLNCTKIHGKVHLSEEGYVIAIFLYFQIIRRCFILATHLLDGVAHIPAFPVCLDDHSPAITWTPEIATPMSIHPGCLVARYPHRTSRPSMDYRRIFLTTTRLEIVACTEAVIMMKMCFTGKMDMNRARIMDTQPMNLILGLTEVIIPAQQIILVIQEVPTGAIFHIPLIILVIAEEVMWHGVMCPMVLITLVILGGVICPEVMLHILWIIPVIVVEVTCHITWLIIPVIQGWVTEGVNHPNLI